jgi:type IV pilus assembly protein PilA
MNIISLDSALSKRPKDRNTSGFSLVELLVAVAVIGILAGITMPAFHNYSARARQTEAKSSLTSIFAAEKSFIAENGYYNGCLAKMGFTPEAGGKHYYTVGFGLGFTGSRAVPTRFFRAVPVPIPPTENPICDTFPAGNLLNETWFKADAYAPPYTGMALATNFEIPPDSGVDSARFLAYAVGRPGFNGSFDYWSIDHNKNLMVSKDTGTVSLFGAAFLGDPNGGFPAQFQ